MIVRTDSLLCRVLERIPFLYTEHARVGNDCRSFARVYFGF